MALHAWECVWVCVCLSEASVYMRACDALSIERVVICKSALPWAGGVKLGKGEGGGLLRAFIGYRIPRSPQYPWRRSSASRTRIPPQASGPIYTSIHLFISPLSSPPLTFCCFQRRMKRRKRGWTEGEDGDGMEEGRVVQERRKMKRMELRRRDEEDEEDEGAEHIYLSS